jgi:hypothetical protein
MKRAAAMQRAAAKSETEAIYSPIKATVTKESAPEIIRTLDRLAEERASAPDAAEGTE